MTNSSSIKARKPRENQTIREFILRNLERHPDDIRAVVGEKFGISRVAVGGYMRRLERDGLLTGNGRTRARRYALRTIKNESFSIELSRGLAEDHIFRFRILPFLSNLPQNIIDICQYGFTEMLNNAIDHSNSPNATISFVQNSASIELIVIDKGIGIFEKIQRHFNLVDPRSALLELSKGKLTSDRKRHSGEGIFYTSRMFSDFTILSGALSYIRHRRLDGDWLLETRTQAPIQGTTIVMRLPIDADWTTRQVFDKYQNEDLYFRKTHVPVWLGKNPDEQLVSRSQAKRILARFDQFSEVMLDFKDVPDIGQAFADEIFRVFAQAHPQTAIVPINMSARVKEMIDYALRSAAEPRDMT